MKAAVDGAVQFKKGAGKYVLAAMALHVAEAPFPIYQRFCRTAGLKSAFAGQLMPDYSVPFPDVGYGKSPYCTRIARLSAALREKDGPVEGDKNAAIPVHVRFGYDGGRPRHIYILLIKLFCHEYFSLHLHLFTVEQEQFFCPEKLWIT